MSEKDALPPAANDDESPKLVDRHSKEYRDAIIANTMDFILSEIPDANGIVIAITLPAVDGDGKRFTLSELDARVAEDSGMTEKDIKKRWTVLFQLSGVHMGKKIQELGIEDLMKEMQGSTALSTPPEIIH